MSDDRSLRIRMRLEAMDRFTRPLRALSAGSIKAAQGLKLARDRLKEIERAQADAQGFRKLSADLVDTGRQLGQARVKLAALARQVSATENPTKKLTRAYADAQRQLSALSTQEGRQSTELREIRTRMRAAGAEAGQLGQHERDLAARFAATNREISEQERRISALGDRNRRFGAARQSFDTINNRAVGLAAGGMSAIATGRAVANPMIDADRDSRTFESGMTDIAQKADMTRGQARLMGLEIVKAARAANQLPAMMQEGVDRLAGFGLDPSKAIEMMTSIGRAATAYKAEIADLSAAAFAANDNLKVPVEQTGRIIDIMAASGKRGAFEVKDMAGAFPELTASMQALKSQGAPAVADLAAALQITRKGAGDSASAANNLQNLLAKINTEDTIKNFKKFGVDVPAAMKKAAAEGRSPIEEIIELTRKATKGDSSKLAFLFGDMQVQQALRPLLENTALYRQIREEALKASGVTDRDFAERMHDAEEMAKKFQVSLAALKLTIGANLLSPLAAIRGGVSNVLDRINAFAVAYPRTSRGLAMVGIGLAALFVVMGGGAIVIAGLMAPFAALAAAGTALGFAVAPLIGTFAAIVAGVGLLAIGGTLLVQRWGGVTAFFGQLGGWFAARWAEVKAAFDWGLVGIVILLAQWGGQLLGALLRGVGWAFVSLAAAVPSMLSGLWRAFDFAMRQGFLPLVRLFGQFGVNTVVGFVKGMFSGLDFVRDSIFSIGTKVTNWFKQKLGIHSPSRVFMGLGGYLMQGLDRGIAAGEGAPLARISRLSRALASAGRLPAIAAPGSTLAVPPPIERMQRLSRRVAGAIAAGSASAAMVAAPAAASPRAPQGIPAAPIRPLVGELHIHAAAGMDERQLADLVERKLRAIMREQQATTRSSYADTPDRDTFL